MFLAATVQELNQNLHQAIDVMRNTDQRITAVSSGCELFLRFITLAKLDIEVSLILLQFKCFLFINIFFSLLKNAKTLC